MMNTITQITLHQENDNPIYGESVLTISINDENTGPFLMLTSYREDTPSIIELDFDDIDKIVEAVKILRNQSSIITLEKANTSG